MRMKQWASATTTTTCAVLTCAVLLSFGAVSMSEAQDEARLIAARTLPVPAAASQALRDSIAAAAAVPAPGDAAGLPETDAEWAAFAAAADAAAGVGVEAAARQLGVTIERGEVEGVPVHRVLPDDVAPAHADHLFLYVHGGGYVFGGGDASVQEAMFIASRARIPVLSIDYRMPPAHPFPAAVDDVVAVYRHVLESRPAGALALGGTSAGGGLTLAAVHRFIALGLDVPGALYAGTPWADLTKTSDTLFTNESVDRVLQTYHGLLLAAARLYAGDHELKHPLISPLYGDFDGFSPTYLVSGTRDMLLSDTVRTHRKLRTAGTVADLNVYEGVSHADYLLVPDSTESHQVFAELNDFLLRHLE